MSDYAQLLLRLDEKTTHLVCEDPWYSCPKSEEYCGPTDRDVCTCGADGQNQLQSDAVVAIRELQAQLAEANARVAQIQARTTERICAAIQAIPPTELARFAGNKWNAVALTKFIAEK